MDEIQKTEMRNYAMAAGFFVLAVQYLLMLIAPFSGIEMSALSTMIDPVSMITAVI